ncbi:glycerophosphodiester phosphodiesterase [Haloprofundus salilacus]|uniref:glycerophosphodiester phosphodiesterase n=1 Tax=Haloprofundus salilacus TaxID=2876190 RepID=UPI001CCA1EDF|nr:glycerophosphodiester phosphodiesterase [Haloprofundus salilacus]
MAQLAGQATTVETEADVSLIAHRGFAGVYPENTRAAFGRAVGVDVEGTTMTPQADVVELDVMPTATGEVVVFHDTELGRLTNAPTALADRKVWETPYETLRRFDVLGTGESVPLLGEILDLIPLDVGVNVELKNPGVEDVHYGALDAGELDARCEVWEPFVERTLSVLADHPHETLVSSFHEGALAAVRELDASVPIATVFWDDIEAGFRTARRHDCEVLHVPWNMVYGTELFNADYHAGPFDPVDLVDIAHEECRRVNAWTVESWYQADQLRQAGVDGIIADYPNLLHYGSKRSERPKATDAAPANQQPNSPDTSVR